MDSVTIRLYEDTQHYTIKGFLTARVVRSIEWHNSDGGSEVLYDHPVRTEPGDVVVVCESEEEALAAVERWWNWDN